MDGKAPSSNVSREQKNVARTSHLTVGANDDNFEHARTVRVTELEELEAQLDA
jgi:hypothetical protein